MPLFLIYGNVRKNLASFVNINNLITQIADFIFIKNLVYFMIYALTKNSRILVPISTKVKMKKKI